MLKEYGGKIHVESKEGVGTEFFIFFPADEKSDDLAISPKTSETVGNKENEENNQLIEDVPTPEQTLNLKREVVHHNINTEIDPFIDEKEQLNTPFTFNSNHLVDNGNILKADEDNNIDDEKVDIVLKSEPQNTDSSDNFQFLKTDPNGLTFDKSDIPNPTESQDFLEDDQNKKKILIVEDQESLRNIATTLLNRIGFEADCVESGENALQHYKDFEAGKSPYSAILLDLTLPGGISGEETLKRIRTIDRDVRIVGTSGYFETDSMDSYRKMGFNALLPKPYSLDNLSKTFEEVFSS